MSYGVKENDCLNEESLSFSSHREYFRGREIFVAGSGRVRAEMSPHFNIIKNKKNRIYFFIKNDN